MPPPNIITVRQIILPLLMTLLCGDAGSGADTPDLALPEAGVWMWWRGTMVRQYHSLGLSKNQKSSFLILSRVNPGWIFYVDLRNINLFIIGCHPPCPLFSLNWLLTPL